jgi:hypothetical protein
MKKKLLLLVVVIVLGLSGTVNATLWDRGGGLIYDDALNITWLQDANYAKTSGYDSDGYMTRTNAMAWASSLEYQGYDDWRLPTIATSTQGWTTNPNGEYNHLSLVDQINQSHPGPFNNFAMQYYWTRFGSSDTSWCVGFSNAYPITEFYQANWWSGNQFAAFAVRNGDSSPASVPAPTAILLLSSGLIWLAGVKRKFKN